MKLKSKLALLSLVVLSTAAQAQVERTVLNRPVLNRPTLPTPGVVLRGDLLKSKIVKPKVKVPVRARLKPVAASKLGPKTRVTVGLYDENGDVAGSKVMTAKQIQDDFDKYTSSNTSKFSRAAGRLKPDARRRLNTRKIKTAVVKRKVFDRELKQNIETFEIPQDFEVSQGMAQQDIRLIAIPVKPILRPIIINPTPGHEAKPYSKNVGYSNTWGSKSKFAAFLNTGFNTYGARQKRQAHAFFKAGGYVFSKTISLIDFYSKVERKNTTNTGYSRIKVLGSTKWESSAKNPSKNYSITREASKRQRFWLGPVPVSVGGAVGGQVGFNLNLYSPDFHSIKGTANPYIDSYGEADAAIDVWLARAGIEGKLRIVKDSLPSEVTLGYNPTKKNLNFKLKVENELRALDGKISVYAKVRKLFGGWRKWSKTILSWTGFSKTWTLVDKNFTVNI